MDRTYVSDGSTIKTEGKCVAMYRFKSKAVDMKNVNEVSSSESLYISYEFGCQPYSKIELQYYIHVPIAGYIV